MEKVKHNSNLTAFMKKKYQIYETVGKGFFIVVEKCSTTTLRIVVVMNYFIN